MQTIQRLSEDDGLSKAGIHFLRVEETKRPRLFQCVDGRRHHSSSLSFIDQGNDKNDEFNL